MEEEEDDEEAATTMWKVEMIDEKARRIENKVLMRCDEAMTLFVSMFLL